VSINSDTFLEAALPLINQMIMSQRSAITAAARLVANCVAAGGVVQAFGTGHSQALALEIAGRAGGFVPTNQLSLRDGILFGGDDAAELDPLAERDPGMASRIYDLASVQQQDLFVVASNSGINGAVVEMAMLAKSNGHPLVAFTSLKHSSGAAPRHPSGRKLFELADVVVDNCAPSGDALLPLDPSRPGGPAVCAISSVTSAIAAQMILADAVEMLLIEGHAPPIYLSANVAQGEAHNRSWEARYTGRIRRGAA
jgi:uncharacterized phosphosugar-binding protein